MNSVNGFSDRTEKPIRYIELFAGIGAQRQALEDAGIKAECAGISEVDKYAIASYTAIHGPTHNFGDITQIQKLPKADLWTWSFPCQSISGAGKGEGFEKGSGTKSSLGQEVLRILENTPVSDRPDYLLAENVDKIVSKRYISTLNRMISDLNALGYTSAWKILDSRDFGIPQKRKRFFMISVKNGLAMPEFPKGFPLTKCLHDITESNVPSKYYFSQKAIDGMIFHKESQKAKGNSFGFSLVSEKDIAHTVTTAEGSHSNSTYIMCPVMTSGHVGVIFADGAYHSVRRLTPRECWRLMGFSDNAFDRASGIEAVDGITIRKGNRTVSWTGNSDIQLYKQGGNSIVVPVLSAIFKNMFGYKSVSAQSVLDKWDNH